MRFLLSLVVATVTLTSANAQQLGTFTNNFVGVATSNPTQITASSDVSYVDVVNFVTRIGITPQTATNSLNSSSWGTTASVNLLKSYQFGFSTSNSSPSAISVNTVTINASRDINGPSDFQLDYSLDGSAFTTLDTVTSLPRNTTSLITFNFVDLGLGTIAPGSSVLFRIHGYNAISTSGQFGLVSVPAITDAISVPFFAPVPEPTTMLGLSALGMFGIGLIRKRFKK